MESLKNIAKNQQSTEKNYFEDPEKDRMMKLILELAEEVCVLRDRLDTCNQLANHGQPATREAIEAFELTDEVMDSRLTRHQEFMEQVFRRF